MNLDLTDEELDMLKAVTSGTEWDDACSKVKKVRDGSYPFDWYEKVITSGLIDQVLGAGAGEIKLVTPISTLKDDDN